MWCKSSHSEAGNCLEVAQGVQVRGSQLKNRDANVSPVRSFTSFTWTAFTTELKQGEENVRERQQFQ